MKQKIGGVSLNLRPCRLLLMLQIKDSLKGEEDHA